MSKDKQENKFDEKQEITEEKLDKVTGGVSPKQGVTTTTGGTTGDPNAVVIQNNP